MSLGLILGALSGAGNYMAGQANNDIKLMDEQTLNAQRSKLEQDRETAIYNMKADRQIRDAATERQRVQGAVGQQMTGLVGQAIASKYATPDAGPADPSTWTPEMQAAVDQSKGLDRQKMMGDPRMQSKAALIAGEYPTATALDKIADSGQKVLGYGQGLFNAEGDMLADNTVGRNQNEAAKAQAALDRAANAAGKGSKPFDQVKALDMVDKYGANLPPNQFVDPAMVEMNGGKRPPDDTGASSFKLLMLSQLGITGTDGDVIGAASAARRQYGALNQKIRDGVQTYVKTMPFDGKNKFDGNQEDADKVQAKFGFDPTGMSKTQIMNSMRDYAMPIETERLLRLVEGGGGGGGGGGGSAPTPAPAQAAPAPAAAPKPAGVVAAAQSTDYVPPADSPAGKVAARRQAAQADQAQRDAAAKTEAQAAFSAVGDDPQKADALQTNSRLFTNLSREQKQKISKLVNGR